MNSITLFLSLVIMFSCSHEQALLNENSIAKATVENESKYLYELELHYISTVIKLNELKEEKQELLNKIEKGSRKSLSVLEGAQKEIDKLTKFKDYLLKEPRPMGIKGPIPMPPKGCLVDSNCDPNKDFRNVVGIVLMSNFKVLSIEIIDEKNNVVGKGTKITKDSFGQAAMLVDTNFKGKAKMVIKVRTASFGEVISTLPIFLTK